jgi:hypothetical protein
MVERRVSRISPRAIGLVVLAVILLVVGIVFFVEPGHHVKRGGLAIVLAVIAGVGAWLAQRRAAA